MDSRTPYGPPPGHVRLRCTVQWDGRDFVGWQSQAAGRSVQDTLHAALAGLAEAARPVAAGRTDAGVHAIAMPVHVDVRAGSLKPPVERLARAVNARLPRDVALHGAELAAAGFHARFSCRARAYVYRVWCAPYRSPLEEGRSLHVPYPLDVAAMRAAAVQLVGRHDFAAFATQEERQTVREVFGVELHEAGPLLEVHVRGESFLRHMVRAMVGTLLLVGEGKLTSEEVRAVLADGERRRAGPNVAPHGLYFVTGEY